MSSSPSSSSLSLELSTPCSTTMKENGLTPFQSFLLRPADIRSVIVFIAACIGTFFLLLHVKALTDAAFPNEHHSSSHHMSALSIPETSSIPTSVPTTLHMLINMTKNDDGVLLEPLPSALSSYQLLSLHALTSSQQSHHYHTQMYELLVLLHGSIELRIMNIHDGHVEDILISVDDNMDPIGILIHPYACHTFTSLNNETPHLVSYYLRDTSINTMTTDLKLILSDRHICPTGTHTYTSKTTST